MTMLDANALEFMLENISEDSTTVMLTWQTLETDLAFAKKWEMEFRKKIFAHYFPSPKSGVNNMPLPANYVLKGTPTENVKINQELMPIIKAEVEGLGYNLDTFLRWKPELGPGYSDLRKAESESNTPNPVGTAIRKMITTTPGAPKLEIVLPAKFAK